MKKSEKKRLEKQIKLQKQAEADRYRASRLNRERDALTEQVKVYADGIKQLNRALDAILAEVAVKFCEEKDGVWEFDIPLPSVMRNTRDYAVQTRVGEDNNSYVVKVTWIGGERGNETDDQGDASRAE